MYKCSQSQIGISSLYLFAELQIDYPNIYLIFLIRLQKETQERKSYFFSLNPILPCILSWLINQLSRNNLVQVLDFICS